MSQLSDKQIKLFKFIDIFGMIFVAIGLFNNIVDGVDHAPFTESLLYPFTHFLVPGINAFTLLISIMYLFMPKRVWLVFMMFIIQTVHLIMTGFETVGIMLYINCLAVGFCAGMAQKNFRIKAFCSVTFLFLILLTIIPERGIHGRWLNGVLDFFYYSGHTAFTTICYIVLYRMLSDKLSFLLGDYKVPDFNPTVDLPEKGENLDLKKLGLTDRQIACIGFVLNTSYNYKQIAEELITSESTVKKDMQDMYKFFGVKNREMLRLLLVQYNINTGV